MSLVGGTMAGSIVGKRSGLSPVASLNTSFTLLARGAFLIIIVNLAIAGALMPILQPFAALYVLVLASASPLLAKESERIHGLYFGVVERTKKSPEEEVEEIEVEDAVDSHTEKADS